MRLSKSTVSIAPRSGLKPCVNGSFETVGSRPGIGCGNGVFQLLAHSTVCAAMLGLTLISPSIFFALKRFNLAISFSDASRNAGSVQSSTAGASSKDRVLEGESTMSIKDCKASV